jgi:NADPH2:quinone reductase
MKAAVITRPGGPEVLEIRDVPRPLPREHEVLVRVRASALNRADLLQREGRYPAPPGAPAAIPGLEIAGEVVDIGGGVTRWSVGDRVFGIVGGGGNAEFVATHERELARIPVSLSWENAAAIPEAFITAHDALITQAAMRAGESVLIHAVGSGVGLAAVQLVRAFDGRAYGTARTADKIDRASHFGLVEGLVITGDPSAVVATSRAWTNERGIDVVLDLVGGPYLAASVNTAAPLGRIILIGLMGGRSATLDLGAILNRRLTIRGTVLRTRSGLEKAEATAAFERDVLPLLTEQKVHPVVDRVLPLEEIREAHTLLQSNSTFGKVVLRID